MDMSQAKAVVLLSGGLDSATTLALAKATGYDTYALSFDYGQRHRVELDSARAVARAGGAVEHRIVKLDLRAIGGSALTSETPVPTGRTDEEMGTDIPVTYVPARNTIFLSYALAYAEVIGAVAIFIGVNHLDYSGYPDCRPEYIKAFRALAALATKAGVEGNPVRIMTPLINMSKAEIITFGHALKVDYGLTRSCYSPDSEGRACGVCDSCILRKRGFELAGVPDPTRYIEEGGVVQRGNIPG